MESIEQSIAGYIADNILFSKHGYPFSEEDSFLENGIIDSMNILELVMFVEETYNIHVPDSDLVPENFDSVAKLARFIRQMQAIKE